MIYRILDALRDQSWGPGILFVLGLCLMTSDGALWPWGNMAGFGLIALTVWSNK